MPVDRLALRQYNCLLALRDDGRLAGACEREEQADDHVAEILAGERGQQRDQERGVVPGARSVEAAGQVEERRCASISLVVLGVAHPVAHTDL